MTYNIRKASYIYVYIVATRRFKQWSLKRKSTVFITWKNTFLFCKSNICYKIWYIHWRCLHIFTYAYRIIFHVDKSRVHLKRKKTKWNLLTYFSRKKGIKFVCCKCCINNIKIVMSDCNKTKRDEDVDKQNPFFLFLLKL